MMRTDASARRSLPGLAGKKGPLAGSANAQGIAYGCAQVMHEPGAMLALPGKVVFVDAGYHVMG